MLLLNSSIGKVGVDLKKYAGVETLVGVYIIEDMKV